MSIPQPSVLANFARVANFNAIEPRITFTRASNATYVGANRLIITANVNTPRFEYSAANGVSLGLLHEEQRVNYLVQSENFSTSWSATNITVSNNATIAPDGNVTADLLIEGTANTALMMQSGTVATANLGVGSIFLKSGPNSGVTWVKVFVTGAGAANGAAAWFNLNTGTVGTNTTIGGGSQAIVVMDPFPDGWYRCKVSANCPGETALSLSFHSASADGSNTRVNTSTYYAWGGQLENGRLATSYIPTTTSTATRVADKMVIEGNNFINTYNSFYGEGTVLLSVYLPPEFALDDTSRDFIGISRNNSFTRSIYMNQSNGSSFWTVGGAGVISTGVSTGENIIALSYSTTSNTVRGFRNGSIRGTLNYNRSITANTDGVNTAANVILGRGVFTPSSNFLVGDRIYYTVPTGNTAIGGLSGNTYYYVSFVNSTAFALSSTLNGANISLTEARTTNPGETHTITLNVPISYNNMYIGGLWVTGNTSGLNGHFKKFAYYPSLMSNTQLQYLTSV